VVVYILMERNDPYTHFSLMDDLVKGSDHYTYTTQQ